MFDSLRRLIPSRFDAPIFSCLSIFALVLPSLMIPPRAHAAQVTLAWDAAPSVTGYTVYYGSTSGEYEGSVDVGAQTTATLVDLDEGKTYFFAVVSYDDAGEESEPAPELVFGDPQEDIAGAEDHAEDAGESASDDPEAAELEPLENDADRDEASESAQPNTDPQVIPQTELSIVRVSSETFVGDGSANAAIDGQTDTFWHTELGAKAPRLPHALEIALGGEYVVTGFRYLPRQDGKTDGMVARYSFYVSADGVNWGKAVATGTFSRGSVETDVVFPETQGSFVRFVAHTEVNGQPWTSMAEINIFAIQ